MKAGASPTRLCYGVSYFPHVVLIDRAGVVRYARIGSGDSNELEQ